jgi:hypothetical protein
MHARPRGSGPWSVPHVAFAHWVQAALGWSCTVLHESISLCTFLGKIDKCVAHNDAMDARDAAIAAKKYFQDTKTLTKFIFETVSAKRDADNWVVICLVQDLFEDEDKKFRLIVNDEGEIMDVEMLDKSPI